jgi:hypothetical protein
MVFGTGELSFPLKDFNVSPLEFSNNDRGEYKDPSLKGERWGGWKLVIWRFLLALFLGRVDCSG